MKGRSTAFAVAALLASCAPAAIEDAGVTSDTPRRPDAGFVVDALSACPLTGGFDGTRYADYTFEDCTPTARRLFYPLVVLDHDGSALRPADITEARRMGAVAAADCAGDVGCVRAAIAFSPTDAEAAGNAVAALLVAGGTSTAVATALRDSGTCALVSDPDDATFIAACVSRTLIELSDGLGFLGEIPASDLDALADTLAARADAGAFYTPLTVLFEEGLPLANRPEPVRYEPLDTENAAALAALATTDFSAFPYVAIVVPGQGPTDETTALNPIGQNRADIGYDRWMAGLAPVVLFTGGHVHPDRTAYSEAVEMRRYLVEERGMPASAILVDPYARHTTTNLRNITRVLTRAGVPMNRAILISTDFIQSSYVTSDTFATRCDEELSYRPFAELARVSGLDVCMLATETSLHVAAGDPLDP